MIGVAEFAGSTAEWSSAISGDEGSTASYTGFFDIVGHKNSFFTGKEIYSTIPLLCYEKAESIKLA